MISLVKKNIQLLNQLCGELKVKNLELFGSAVDDKSFASDSDIDFLVEFMPMDPTKHSKAYFQLLEKLQDLFKMPIDLVEINAVKNPYFIESINKKKEKIYAA